MIVYSVRIRLLKPRRLPAFVRYLKTKHIADVLAQPGFRSAELRRVEGEPVLVVDYRVSDAKYLKRYFNSAATALRAEVIEKFGDDLAITREISSSVAEF